MKKFLSLMVLAALGLVTESNAQSSIATARTQAIGTTVTVRGIVTNGSELGPIRYIQDNVAGIAAYGPSLMSNVVLGDSVLVTGVLKNYNGLLEIDPVSTVNVIASNKALPAAVVFTAATAANAYAEQYESRLVKINSNTSITTTSGGSFSTFAGNTNYRLNGVSGQDVRTNTASTGTNGIVGKPAPTGTFNLTGIMSQYSPSGTGGYQLLPRLYTDLELGATPNITLAPYPSNITTSSLTINFKTQNPGTASINYGTSPSALNQTVSSALNTTSHSIAIPGLQASTFYYVQVTSTNSVGSSVSNVIPVITASNSTGKMKAYFNMPVNTAYGPANNPAKQLPNALDDTLVAYINRATESIDMTMYGFNNQNLMNLPFALNNAKARGVNVRLVIDTYGSQGISGLNASIPVVIRTVTPGINHNKFIVIDANAINANKAFVWTGSTNYTAGQINSDPNSVIIIQDQSLAKAFRMEFEEMFGNGTTSGGVFGSAKADNTPHHFNVGGSLVELYFSPSDNVNNKLIETIGTADHDLHVATVQVTRTDLANAVKNQLVQNPNLLPFSEFLVGDSSSDNTASYSILRSAFNNRFVKWNKGGNMHHKHMIIDVGNQNSDPLVWVSSHNWSTAATTTNDENTLIIHNYEIANQYYQEFAKLIQTMNKGFIAYNFIITGLADDLNASVKTVKVYPNPNAGSFNVSVTNENIKEVNLVLTDLAGKTVYTSTIKVNGAQDIKVETTNLPKGIYNLQLKSNQGMQFSKVAIF